jgi:hypothetical protein
MKVGAGSPLCLTGGVLENVWNGLLSSLSLFLLHSPQSELCFCPVGRNEV